MAPGLRPVILETRPHAEPFRSSRFDLEAAFTGNCFQVVLAIVLGVFAGPFRAAVRRALKPLGDAFIKLVKMIIAR